MKIFYDSEFTGLHQNTTLISIGFYAEDSRTFYAEFNDYDQSQVDDWIRKNVIDNLRYKPPDPGEDEYYTRSKHTENIPLTKFWNIRMRGNTKQIKKELLKWFRQFDIIEIWSDLLPYDWVLFVKLIAEYKNGYPHLPSNVYYIPFDICTLFKLKNINPDIDREKFVVDNLEIKNDKILKEFFNNKHISLWDSYIIKCCYEILIKI